MINQKKIAYFLKKKVCYIAFHNHKKSPLHSYPYFNTVRENQAVTDYFSTLGRFIAFHFKKRAKIHFF